MQMSHQFEIHSLNDMLMDTTREKSNANNYEKTLYSISTTIVIVYLLQYYNIYTIVYKFFLYCLTGPQMKSFK